MKNLKRFLVKAFAGILSASVVLSAAACSTTTNKPQSGVLTIRYFEGGYGTEWLEYAAKKYQEEHPGFKYQLYPDTQITNTVNTYLKSGQNLADIYMTQGSASWTEWVSLGYIENLESVYEAEVNTSEGKRKIKDYLDADVMKKNYSQRIYGQGAYYPWMLPWASVGISFAYNESILLTTKHTVQPVGGNFTLGEYWTEPPKTVNELAAYCTDVLARNDGIKPFSLPFSDGMHWLEYFMSVWWAQYQGVYEENLLTVKDGDGAYYDFYNFESAEVWKQVGIQKAIDQWRTLIIGEDGNWKNTVDNITEHSVQDAEKIFARGESALVLAGSFSYKEMQEYITNKNNVFKMMSMPLYDDGTTAMKKDDGTTANINYFMNDETIFIPSGAANKDLAKDFLIYLCNEEMLLDFTKRTGTMRPFDYNPLELLPDYEWGAYTKSYLDLYFGSDIRLSNYPANKDIEDVSPMYLYKHPSMFGRTATSSIINDMRTMTGEEIMVGKNNGKNVYSVTKTYFNTWKTELGIE